MNISDNIFVDYFLWLATRDFVREYKWLYLVVTGSLILCVKANET